MMWYERKDGTVVFKKGRYRELEIYKRPHGGYCCNVFKDGYIMAANGFFGTSLPTITAAKKWGKNKLKELNII